MAVIDRVTLTGTDWDPNATISGVYPSNNGSFSITGGSVYVAVQTGRPGGFQFGDSVPFDPGIGFVLPAGATGVRFKNQDSTKAATVTAAIASQGQLVPVGGSATSVNVTTSTEITGIIPAAGTTPTAGTGFTYTHAATGIYVFTFTNPFLTLPNVQVTPNQFTLSGGALYGYFVSSISINGFTVTFQLTGGGKVDTAFSFTAVPTV